MHVNNNMQRREKVLNHIYRNAQKKVNNYTYVILLDNDLKGELFHMLFKYIILCPNWRN